MANVAKVFPQLCEKCSKPQGEGVTVYLPSKLEEIKGKRFRWSPPVIVCASCKPTVRGWDLLEAVVSVEA